MTNGKYYNAEVKERFFDTFTNENTKETAQYAFKKAKATEELMKKDIYDMNIDELGELIKDMSASTINSAYNYVYKFNQYIDWAIKNGYRSSNINPFLSVDDRRKWVEPFIAVRKKSVFTRDEILNMCKKLVNPHDQAVLLGLFEGIVGEGFSELLNLRMQDIKKIKNQYYATLTNNTGAKRLIEISDTLAKYLEDANNATIYYNKNGESHSIKSPRSLLVESSFIFKKSTRGKKYREKDEGLDLFYVNRKFQIYKEVFETKFLTARDIVNSGIMHLINEFYEKQGFVTEENWEEIAERFDTSFITYKDGSHRNIFALKQIATENLFEEKYGYTFNELV